LTPSGKIDRARLPAPATESVSDAVHATPLEGEVARAWQDVLGIERAGRNDNFFDLGGHSLLAAKLVMRLREALGCELPIGAIFDRPVLSDFAAGIEELREQQNDNREQELFEISAQPETCHTTGTTMNMLANVPPNCSGHVVSFCNKTAALR